MSYSKIFLEKKCLPTSKESYHISKLYYEKTEREGMSDINKFTIHSKGLEISLFEKFDVLKMKQKY